MSLCSAQYTHNNNNNKKFNKFIKIYQIDLNIYKRIPNISYISLDQFFTFRNYEIITITTNIKFQRKGNSRGKS